MSTWLQDNLLSRRAQKPVPHESQSQASKILAYGTERTLSVHSHPARDGLTLSTSCPVSSPLIPYLSF